MTEDTPVSRPDRLFLPKRPSRTFFSRLASVPLVFDHLPDRSTSLRGRLSLLGFSSFALSSADPGSSIRQGTCIAPSSAGRQGIVS